MAQSWMVSFQEGIAKAKAEGKYKGGSLRPGGRSADPQGPAPQKPQTRVRARPLSGTAAALIGRDKKPQKRS